MPEYDDMFIERLGVPSFVENQLLSRTEFYPLYSQLDDLSGGARIESINVVKVVYEEQANGSIHFFGTLMIEVTKLMGITRNSFTGTFEGSFDRLGIQLDSAALDIST